MRHDLYRVGASIEAIQQRIVMGYDLFKCKPAKISRHMPVTYQSDIVSKAHGPAHRGINAKLRHATSNDELINVA